jgi:hypothetical protein
MFYIFHSSISFHIFFSSPIYYITSLLSLTTFIYISLGSKLILGLVLFSTSCHYRTANHPLADDTIAGSLRSLELSMETLSAEAIRDGLLDIEVRCANHGVP